MTTATRNPTIALRPEEQLVMLRTRHVIEPIPVYAAGTLDPEWMCRVDEILILRRKGGWGGRDGRYRELWRHDPADVRAIEGRAATWPK